MERYLKKLKVGKKMQFVFGVILITLILTAIVAIVSIVVINHNMKTFYNKAYIDNKRQLEIRKDVELVQKYVLWSMTTTDLDKTQEKIHAAENCAAEVNKNIESLKKNFSNKNLMDKLENALSELKSYRIQVLDLASNNQNDEAMEIFNNDYNIKTENMQNVLLEVSNYLDNLAINQYKNSSIVGIFSIIIMALIGIASILICIFIGSKITKVIKQPILELEHAALNLQNGILDISITYESEDELGNLANSFHIACKNIYDIISDTGYVLKSMASGNFNVETNIPEYYIGEFTQLKDSIHTLNKQLNQTLRQINTASEQVAMGSVQLAENAQSLAEGATEQAGAVEELTATIEDISNMSEKNAAYAIESYQKIHVAEIEAESSQGELKELLIAMERISNSSKQIQNIIESIEDIASQTNLLSLNASIEAARAGEAGKGFAVVADQIGKLASDSAQSAVDTSQLIQESLKEIENGNQITNKTVISIKGILKNMKEFAENAKVSSETSSNQASMLKQVEQGVEQISSVVQSNSASAEETSATSEELSSQSETLKELVEQFQLKNSN